MTAEPLQDAPVERIDPRLAPEVEGLLWGTIGVVIFGGTLPATRLAVTGFDPIFVTAGRAAIAGALAGIILLYFRRRLPSRSILPEMIASAALLAGGFPLFLSLGLVTAESSHGAVVLAILPLLTAAAGSIIGKERPSLKFWMFALLGTLTVLAFVVVRGDGRWVVADGFFLLASLSAAFGYAISGKLSRTMPGWEVIFWQLVFVLPFTLLIAALTSPNSLAAIPAAAWLGFAYVSLFSMLIGLSVWNKGMAMGGVARVGQLQLLQVFVTLGLSALLLGEKLDGVTVGFALAVVIIVALGRRA